MEIKNKEQRIKNKEWGSSNWFPIFGFNLQIKVIKKIAESAKSARKQNLKQNLFGNNIKSHH
ncbi:hypothetical protein B0A67_02265 [Flavobacterium aquidurense]|nr:hypothetical protein B0A67_02265 [Flavobacterium aquidurense]